MNRLKLIALPQSTETQLRAAEEPPVHIGDMIRAEVATRDWRAMHIAADRRDAIHMADATERRRGHRSILVRVWPR